MCWIVHPSKGFQKAEVFNKDLDNGIIPVRKIIFQRRFLNDACKPEIVNMIDGWEQMMNDMRVQSPGYPVDTILVGRKIHCSFQLLYPPIAMDLPSAVGQPVYGFACNVHGHQNKP